MTPERKTPLISKIARIRKEPKIIGRGLETRPKGHITSFKVESDELASYTEKPLRSEKAARETLEMYQQLNLLGLPVVSFLKIIQKQEKSTGQNQYSVAMEDLSAHDKNLVLMMGDTTENPDNPANKLDSQELLEKAKNTEELIDQMARALAVLHNNGIYEFHNKLSFFLVASRSAIGEKSERPTLDFKILDYSNFTNDGSENSSVQDTLSDNVPGFKHGIERNLEYLKKAIGETLRKKLEEKYKKYREERLMAYTFSAK
ncbi:MAG TPA: hypothetical protein VJB95_02630 [Candidatus Paceibacterota bacterium]